MFVFLTAVTLGLCGVQDKGQAVPAPPPPPPPAATAQAGPTMEQTVQFMKKVLGELSPVTVSYTIEHENQDDAGVWHPNSNPTTFPYAPVQITEWRSENPCAVTMEHPANGKPKEVFNFGNYAPTSIRVLTSVELYQGPVNETSANTRNWRVTNISPVFYVVNAGTGNTSEQIGPFEDKTLAERFAKALIHATTLCHKDEGPSPF